MDGHTRLKTGHDVALVGCDAEDTDDPGDMAISRTAKRTLHAKGMTASDDR